MLIMKGTIFILISFLTLTAFIGCEDAPPDPVAIKNLNAQEGYKLIEENKNNPNFVILDVRTPEEFNAGHIKNAVNIDYKNPDFKENVDKLAEIRGKVTALTRNKIVFSRFCQDVKLVTDVTPHIAAICFN